MEHSKTCPVVRFDIGCRDSTKTQEFYEKVFGWKASKSKYNLEVNTCADEGIQGSITSLGHEPHHYIMFYIQVDNIERAIRSIEAEGGKNHIGPLPTGTGQTFAWVNDPDGNMIGIVSNESK